MLKTLKPSEIAKFCDVHERTVSRWINKGNLKGHKLVGRGNYRVQVNDFVKFLTNQGMPVPASLLQKPNILIVDDEQNVRSVIKRALKRNGFATSEASGGFEAGVLMHQHKPQLVTIDLSMPGLSGLEVIRFIRTRDEFKDIKILVVSGMPQAELVDAIAAGADGYITKPFNNETLISNITSLLNVNRFTQEKNTLTGV